MRISAAVLRMVAWLLWLVLCMLPLGALAEALPSGLEDADLSGAIDAYVAEHLDTTAAVSIGIVRGQQTLLERAYGYADREAGLLAGEETVYEWASVSKLLVWVSVMQLEEQGLLDLEADIRAYLPDGFLSRLRYDEPVTLLHLMHHNAGWEKAFADFYVAPGTPVDTLEETLRVSEPRQVYPPGQVTAYCNWGVALAAYIVERISGEDYGDYVRTHIFAPLGMERTALSATLADQPWVQAQRLLTQGYAGTTPVRNQYVIPLYPVGMAAGTLGDLQLFLKALLPEEGQRSPLFQEADTLPSLLAPSDCYGNGEARNSHGFWWLSLGVPVAGHMGNTVAFSSYLLLDPASNTGFVVMTNQGLEKTYNIELPKLVFGAPEAAALPADADARGLRGFYCAGQAAWEGYLRLFALVNTAPFFGGDAQALTASIFGRAFYTFGRPDRAKASAEVGTVLPMTPVMDFVRVPTPYYLGMLVVLVLFWMALCYFLITWLGALARWVRRRKRTMEPTFLSICHLLLCALGLGVGLNVAWMLYDITHYAPRAVLAAHMAYNDLFILATIAYLVLLGVARRRSGRRLAPRLWWTGLAALFTVLAIVVWHLYWL